MTEAAEPAQRSAYRRRRSQLSLPHEAIVYVSCGGSAKHCEPRHRGQSQAHAVDDARDGTGVGGAEPSTSESHTEHPGSHTCWGNLAICRSNLSGRLYLHPDGSRLRLLGVRHRLVQPPRAGVASVQHMDSTFCVDALKEALERFLKPETFNTDQGSQFTADAFTNVPSPCRHHHQHGRLLRLLHLHAAAPGTRLPNTRRLLSRRRTKGCARLPQASGGFEQVVSLLEIPLEGVP